MVRSVDKSRPSERLTLSLTTTIVSVCWTWLLTTVMVTISLASVYFLLALPVVALNGHAHLMGAVKFGGLLAGGLFGVVAVIAVPVIIGVTVYYRRATKLTARGSDLIGVYPQERVRLPLRECTWKVASVFSMDRAGSLFRFQPYLIVTHLRVPDDRSRQIEAHLISCGLTPEAFDMWKEFLSQSEAIPSRSGSGLLVASCLVLCSLGGLSGGVLVGSALAALGFQGPILLAWWLIGFGDGLVVGWLWGMARFGPLQYLKAMRRDGGPWYVGLVSLTFSVAAMKFVRGMGIPAVIFIAALNGAIGVLIGWIAERAARERINQDAPEHATS